MILITYYADRKGTGQDSIALSAYPIFNKLAQMEMSSLFVGCLLLRNKVPRYLGRKGLDPRYPVKLCGQVGSWGSQRAGPPKVQ